MWAHQNLGGAQKTDSDESRNYALFWQVEVKSSLSNCHSTECFFYKTCEKERSPVSCLVLNTQEKESL